MQSTQDGKGQGRKNTVNGSSWEKTKSTQKTHYLCKMFFRTEQEQERNI